LPIRERLANVRRKIFPYDVVDAYEGINITDRLRSGYPITESQYSTRNGQILPGFERTARTEETN
jgi:hypothetical protein